MMTTSNLDFSLYMTVTVPKKCVSPNNAIFVKL